MTDRRVSDLEEREDGRTVVGDGHVSDIVHQHLVETGIGMSPSVVFEEQCKDDGLTRQDQERI